MLYRTQPTIALTLWASLVFQLPTVHGQNQLISNPSNGTTILVDESLDTASFSDNRISITSDIPVTIQRYADINADFLAGSQPVSAGDVRVVVTSDCDTFETNVIPTVVLDGGTINVKLNATANMSFLEPSWYQAFWSYMSFWCAELTTTVASVNLTEGISMNGLENDTTVEINSASTTSTAKAETTVESNFASTTSTAKAKTNDTAASEGSSLPEEELTDDAPQSRCDDENKADGSPSSTENSASFSLRRSFLHQTMSTFMLLFATNVIFYGVAGNFNVLGFGKVAVAAIAVSTLFSKAYHPKKNPVQDSTRKLQSCNLNAEILLDGCHYSFDINAPSARIIDAVLVNLTSADNPERKCTTDYSAILTFPVSDNNTELQPNTTVSNLVCDMIAEGRPFVDATGKSLHASYVVEADDSSWLGYLTEESSAITTNFGNETKHDASLLGEEWTRRAIAEHASVASFAAFSIALMTNQAPSLLVEDALKAGLDEVRHAKVSFDIATMLMGKDVGPGPLPTSSFEFKQDLTVLALAVAKEGCVDETLSAFSAALEANAIHDVIENGSADIKYSNIDHTTLAMIRDELRKIAVEESSHSALAWRTLTWVCSVDYSACNAVHEEVFDGNRLKERIDRVISSKFFELRHLLQKEWEKVYDSHKLKHFDDYDGVIHEQPPCSSMYEGGVDSNELSFLSQLTANIRRGILC